MEKRINKKIDNWRTTFKNDIIKQVQPNIHLNSVLDEIFR